MKKITFVVTLFVVAFLNACNTGQQQQNENVVNVETDPLPSWNDRQAKQSIIDFVQSATNESSADYVKPADRIAVFDNDGTLWSEQPYYFQLQFALDRVKALSPEHPEWKKDPLLQAVINEDIAKVLSFGEKGLLEIVALSHSGISTNEFSDAVLNWINTAKHPKTGKLYKEMVYQPMIELLDYLRANGFKTFIVSGGGIDFMRPWTEEVYGIPSEQVVGSSVKTKFEIVDGKPVLMKLPEINFIDDKEAKPVGIHQHIGKRPIAAFGNSDGDLQMLQYTAAGDKKSLVLCVHHTDSIREWAYDRNSHIGQLDKGLDEAIDKGWVVVDMKDDWNKIFAD
jgi:phosphoserine phosphatase